MFIHQNIYLWGDTRPCFIGNIFIDDLEESIITNEWHSSSKSSLSHPP